MYLEDGGLGPIYLCVSRTQDSLQNWLQSEIEGFLSQVKRKTPRYVKTTEELMSPQLRERETKRRRGLGFQRPKLGQVQQQNIYREWWFICQRIWQISNDYTDINKGWKLANIWAKKRQHLFTEESQMLNVEGVSETKTHPQNAILLISVGKTNWWRSD